MISKQEGGTERGRLLAPGGTGGLGSEKISSPSLPGSLWLLRPGGELLLPGSEAPEPPAGPARIGEGAGTRPNKGCSFAYRSHLWSPIGLKPRCVTAEREKKKKRHAK